MSSPTIAEVWLWGERVGAAAEFADGRILFEYDEQFRRSALEVSPTHLPLSLGGPIEFAGLYRSEAFEGLPGLLSDALPDRFGNAVIRRYFESQGDPQRALSPVQKLLYVGERGMGALRFRPALAFARTAPADEALEVAQLVMDARRVISGSPEVSLPEMMQLSASAGGARAKAVILWNEERARVRSAFAPPAPGDEHWLIKFDGVSDLERQTRDVRSAQSTPHNRIELAYHKMARLAGLQMADCRLLEHDGLAHFMTRRFDRPPQSASDQRAPHMHTLGGITHTDYNHPGHYSYEEYLRLVLQLTQSDGAVASAFLHAVFNVLSVNQDDHVKNFGFLMRPNGEWALSPVYDLTHARGLRYTRQHQMTLGGKRDDITRDDLHTLAKTYGVRARGKAQIGAVIAALKQWPRLAADAGVPDDWAEAIGMQHAARINGSALP
ncbi:MAG: serine/threonine-protein kinase HipA [Flavobacteriales bacterium]|jgi:serine/threonine-protein kinase HipA